MAVLGVETWCSVGPKWSKSGSGVGLSLSGNIVVVGPCGSGFPKGEECSNLLGVGCLNLLYGGVALL